MRRAGGRGLVLRAGASQEVLGWERLKALVQQVHVFGWPPRAAGTCLLHLMPCGCCRLRDKKLAEEAVAAGSGSDEELEEGMRLQFMAGGAQRRKGRPAAVAVQVGCLALGVVVARCSEGVGTG